jgi:hypothetical protein
MASTSRSGAREIHGLLGHNGSGKSTLVKILSGYHAPDPGAELRLHGESLRLPLSLAEQRARGLAFVHQNLGLAPQISVLENMRVVEITTGRRPWVDWRAQRRAAVAALRQFGLPIDPDQPVSTLSPVERALVAIVRAFSGDRRDPLGPRAARPAGARRADAVPRARRRRPPVPADAPGGRRGRERAVHLARPRRDPGDHRPRHRAARRARGRHLRDQGDGARRDRRADRGASAHRPR